MNFILADGPEWDTLLPLTFTRPTAEIRIGILTLREKWEHLLKTKTFTITQTHLTRKYPTPSKKDSYISINPTFLPTKNLIQAIHSLEENQALTKGKTIIALYKNPHKIPYPTLIKEVPYPHDLIHIEHPWDIFQQNTIALEQDFKLLTQGRKSAPLSKSNRVTGKDIFVEEGAIVEHAILNAQSGAIYIGKKTQIMEGCLIRGGLALCEGAVLKMGAKIYGATTIGPYCKVGGEINNSILFSYSNKAHDGFLGNSVLGQWCNLGAGTNTSNLKNNYSKVYVWNHTAGQTISTKLQFCGLFMGDYSKSAINTQFNTGSVVGVSVNVFGYGFPPKHIPSFTWGGIQKSDLFDFEKTCETAQLMMSRRNQTFYSIDKEILRYLFYLTQKRYETSP
ncbi:MAG: putative sugar nucleotidyl transferase [Flavobacteriales bacterium]